MLCAQGLPPFDTQAETLKMRDCKKLKMEGEPGFQAHNGVARRNGTQRSAYIVSVDPYLLRHPTPAGVFAQSCLSNPTTACPLQQRGLRPRVRSLWRASMRSMQLESIATPASSSIFIAHPHLFAITCFTSQAALASHPRIPIFSDPTSVCTDQNVKSRRLELRGRDGAMELQPVRQLGAPGVERDGRRLAGGNGGRCRYVPNAERAAAAHPVHVLLLPGI